jgi:hypothetical protein
LDTESSGTEETRHRVACKPHRCSRRVGAVGLCHLEFRHNASLLWHSPVAATHLCCELSLFARECVHRAGHRIARVHHLSIVVRHLRRRRDGSSSRGRVEKRHGVRRLGTQLCPGPSAGTHRYARAALARQRAQGLVVRSGDNVRGWMVRVAGMVLGATIVGPGNEGLHCALYNA